jgi:VanZ family protein
MATAIVLWGTLAPQAQGLGAGFAMADKLWHALSFWGWACLVTCGWTRSVGVIMLAALGMGGLIECIQPLAGRAAEFGDLAADLVGALLGIMTGRGLLALFVRCASIGARR